MPAVSFLMVFHRVTPFLVPAVRSVLTQTFSDLELVLVDNGTGLGVAPLGEWGRDTRIRLVTLAANGGIAAGHVAALAQARGDYFALLDHDDIALPDRIERQVAALRRDPRLGIVSSQVEAIDEQGRITGSEFVLLNEKDQHVYSAFNMPGITPSYTGRRDVFQRFPYRPELDCATDYDFFTRAAEAWPLAGVPEVLTQYRHHREQTSVQKGSQQILAACMIRILTARRRQGRPEDLAGLAAEFRGWIARPPGAGADLCAVFHPGPARGTRAAGRLPCAQAALGAPRPRGLRAGGAGLPGGAAAGAPRCGLPDAVVPHRSREGPQPETGLNDQLLVSGHPSGSLHSQSCLSFPSSCRRAAAPTLSVGRWPPF